jgi:serine/threonine protein kinase
MSESIRELSACAAGEKALADLVAEITDRLHRGEPVDLESCIARHPELADRLPALLPALELLHALGSSPGPASGAASGTPNGVEPAGGTLGDFRILREVGRGGMGIVYEAERMSLSRRVALKVLPFAATMDPRHLQRFKIEAQAAAQLHHTNIVPVHYVGCERGVHFYAMQYIEGESLAAVIAALRKPSEPRPLGSGGTPELTTPYTPLPDGRGSDTASVSDGTKPIAALSTILSTTDAAYYRTVAELGIQAAEALDFAHEHGIIHRDIKPANLLVENCPLPTAQCPPRLWVTDFGLAQVQGDARMTMTGDLVGTLRYMSPEQALAKRVVVDHRTDVYSLGATLYELLTLEPAFTGTDRQELLRQIAFEEPRTPRRANRTIPVELETIVLKALEKNPADRYATAKEIAEDLRRFVHDEPIRARRPSLAQRTRKWARRHRMAATTAAACMLLTSVVIAAIIGWQAHDWEKRRDQTAQAVAQALGEADSWQHQQRLPEALSAVRRADGLVRGGTADEALRRLVQARLADLELLESLDNARLYGSGVKDGHFDNERTDALFGDAFRAIGIDVEGQSQEEAGERLGRTTVAAELAATLDEWALLCRLIRGQDDRTAQHLLAVAQATEPGGAPGQLRKALASMKRRALVAFAASEEPRHLLPASLRALTETLMHANEVALAEALLRQARQRHSDDFWLNEYLGILFQDSRPARMEEAIRYYTAATSLRPGSPGAHVNLAHALTLRGRLDEAIAEYRETIRLKKDYAEAHMGRIGLGALAFATFVGEAAAGNPKCVYLGGCCWGAYPYYNQSERRCFPDSKCKQFTAALCTPSNCCGGANGTNSCAGGGTCFSDPGCSIPC